MVRDWRKEGECRYVDGRLNGSRTLALCVASGSRRPALRSRFFKLSFQYSVSNRHQLRHQLRQSQAQRRSVQPDLSVVRQVVPRLVLMHSENRSFRQPRPKRLGGCECDSYFETHFLHLALQCNHNRARGRVFCRNHGFSEIF